MFDRDVRIQQTAYEIWAGKGYPHGADWDHWFEAEQQVDKELLKTFKPKKPRAKKAVKAA